MEAWEFYGLMVGSAFFITVNAIFFGGMYLAEKYLDSREG